MGQSDAGSAREAIGRCPTLSPYSFTVVFPQPGEAIVRTYQLACNKGEAHAIVMPNVTDTLISRFVSDYLAWWKASQRQGDLQ